MNHALAILRCTKAELLRLNWTQGTLARNEHKAPVNWFDGDARAVCLEGAMLRAGGGLSAGVRTARQMLESMLPRGTTLVAWNDNRGTTRAKVLALLDRAIEMEERRK